MYKIISRLYHLILIATYRSYLNNGDKLVANAEDVEFVEKSHIDSEVGLSYGSKTQVLSTVLYCTVQYVSLSSDCGSTISPFNLKVC